MSNNFFKRKIANFIANSILNLDSEKKSKLYLELKDSFIQENYKSFRRKYQIPDEFKFNGEGISFYGKGKITCGTNSYIGSYSTIQADENCEVSIGNNCSISHNVRIYTASKIADQDLDVSSSKKKQSGNVSIGNGAWIGANVFINPGVAIGENSVIGANSVVTKDIEPNAIYGGVPAKLIKMKQTG